MSNGTPTFNSAESYHRHLERQRKYNRRYYKKKKQALAVQDEKKVQLSCRVPEWVMARFQLLMGEGIITGKYPCRTIGEAAVWVIKRGFKQLEDDPVVGAKMKYAQAEHQISNIARARKEGMNLLHRASEECAALLAADEPEQAYHYFTLAVDAMKSLDPNVWTDQALKQFQRKFPDMAAKHKKKIPAKNIFKTVREDD